MKTLEPIALAKTPRHIRGLRWTNALRRDSASTILAIILLCVTATTGSALDHSGTIIADETWYASDNPHNIVGNLYIDTDVTLTLEPGVEVLCNSAVNISVHGSLAIADGVDFLFGDWSRLYVYGTLTAAGTSGAGILIDHQGSYVWYGIQILSTGSATFDHCTIEHADYGIYTSTSGTVSLASTTIRNCNTGIYASNGTVQMTSVSLVDNSGWGYQGDGILPAFLDANIVIDNCGTGFAISNIPGLSLTSLPPVSNCGMGVQVSNCETPTLDNLVLTGNGSALYLQDTGEFNLGGGNVIGGNGNENGWPLTIDIGAYPAASCVIPTTGNDNNDIQVYGSTSDRIGNWRNFPGLDYIFASHCTISAGGSLTIEEGVNVRVTESCNISVHGSLAIADGVDFLFGDWSRLYVYGTLTAAGTSGAGILIDHQGSYVWYGIQILSTGSATFDHCTIEHADYGIYTSTSGTVSLASTTIRNCNTGIYASNGTISFMNTKIIDNTAYGVYLDGATPVFGSSLAEWNDIYGNGSGYPGRDLRNGTTDIEARWVHWGTMDHAQILTQTWDLHDDHSLGYVQILPFINATHDGQTTAVDDPRSESTVPVAFGLFQNAPNPFNPSTVIRFDLTKLIPVQLKVYDISGALVATLLDDHLPAGHHEAVWRGCDDQGRSVPSGMYFYRIVADENIETREMMLIK